MEALGAIFSFALVCWAVGCAMMWSGSVRPFAAKAYAMSVVAFGALFSFLTLTAILYPSLARKVLVYGGFERNPIVLSRSVQILAGSVISLYCLERVSKIGSASHQVLMREAG